jgi:hypothetical protein
VSKSEDGWRNYMKNDNEQRWQPVGIELAYSCAEVKRERSPQQNLPFPRNVGLSIHKFPACLNRFETTEITDGGKRRSAELSSLHLMVRPKSVVLRNTELYLAWVNEVLFG